MDSLFYRLGRYCFRIGKFFEFPYWRVGDVYFFLHSSWQFGIERATDVSFAGFFFGPLEICVMDNYYMLPGDNQDTLLFGDENLDEE